RRQSALDGFIRNSLTESEHRSNVLPVNEKMLLRSPEISLSGAVQLFKALVHRPVDDGDLKYAAEAILTPVSTGKSTGPEHRQAIYSLLAFIPPSLQISSLIIKIVSPLMEKETNDPVLSAISEALPKHIVSVFQNSGQLERVTISIIIKEMSSVKPASRRAAVSMIGQVFWKLSLLV
ncbi:14332_t:CDS:2, partial [Acaulospora colombiana]